jgi:hypothetical protein
MRLQFSDDGSRYPSKRRLSVTRHTRPCIIFSNATERKSIDDACVTAVTTQREDKFDWLFLFLVQLSVGLQPNGSADDGERETVA